MIASALADPEGFVLKPQREGGGNNYYGSAMVAALQRRAGLGAFILMERIRPAVTAALFMRKGEVASSPALSELGVYSVYVRTPDGRVLLNEAVGHLLRTKTADSDEARPRGAAAPLRAGEAPCAGSSAMSVVARRQGGVAAGFAVLDSPYLT